MFLTVKADDYSFSVCASYFPPGSDISVFKHHFDLLHSFTNKLKCDKVILLGDYLPRSFWFSDFLHYLPLEYINPNMRDVLQELVQNYSMFDLIQHFTPLPTEGYSLDHYLQTSLV